MLQQIVYGSSQGLAGLLCKAITQILLEFVPVRLGPTATTALAEVAFLQAAFKPGKLLNELEGQVFRVMVPQAPLTPLCRVGLVAWRCCSLCGVPHQCNSRRRAFHPFTR